MVRFQYKAFRQELALIARAIRMPDATTGRGRLRVVRELSRFAGIVIRMFTEVGVPHHAPHFHAYYQNAVGIFSIDPVDLIAGALPKRQQRLVEAWAELHQDELAADWQRLQAGTRPLPIEPLK